MSKSNELVLVCDFETQNHTVNKEVVSNVIAFACKEVYQQKLNYKIDIEKINEINNKTFYFDSINLDQSSMNKFFDYLFTFKEYQKVNIFFHNLKNFDGFFLVPYLLTNFSQIMVDHDLENNNFYLMYVSGQMLNVKLKKDNVIYNFIDSLAFFPQTSLKQLGQIIDFPKLEFDDLFDIRKEKPNKTERYLNFVEYTKRDVEILAKFLLFFVQKTKINLLNSVSAASVSYKFFQEKHGKNKPGLFLNSEDQWHLINQSYFGGFNYINEKYKYEVHNNINYFDINSAYPYVLKQPLPYGDLEIYKYQNGGAKLLKIQINKLEISELDIGTIRSKKYNERFIKNSDSPFIYYIWEFELNWVKKFYKVFNFEVLKIYWVKLKKIADKYIDFWYEIKQKNAAKATPEQKMWNFLAKIELNSLYGKFGEKLIKPQRVYVEKEKVKNKPEQILLHKQLYHILTIHNSKTFKNLVEVTLIPENPNIGKIKNIAIASYVTAKVRIEIYKQILKNQDSFVYCDTDSIILKDNHIESHYISNEKLGLWKYEHKNVKGYFIKPKAYVLIDPLSGKIIFKSAGFTKALLELTPLSFDNIHNIPIILNKLSSIKSANGVVLIPTKHEMKGGVVKKLE